ncbi:MAG TPA: cytochrome c maturation protein CcmE [Afifellaceae bacterium]|jgi:cytochrome c-type biogenesis protein CcmE|nr:cytochrome c maturation protein CcmE [Afifellaceae bacterium]
MTRKKKQRLTLIAVGGALLACVVALVAYALNDQLVYFYMPADIVEKNVQPGTRIRLGGLVEDGSVVRAENGVVSFVLADGTESIKVSYQGLLPDLFREGQGIVAEGTMQAGGAFVADSVLAKHDENYMPREMADALKEQGVWNDGKEVQ